MADARLIGKGEKTRELGSAGMEAMFAYKSKLAEKCPERWIENYKELYAYLKGMQERGELPIHPNYLGDNELAKSIYEKKYYLKDLKENKIESCPEDVFVRLASFVAAVEGDIEQAKELAAVFYRQMYDGLWLPGGRVIAGGGDLYRLKTLANCFVTKIKEDNIESIYTAAYEAARTYSYGGGIGIDISCLRPKGSVVHNAADSSTGSVSFMELYSMTTGLIGQSGRRGALMITIDVKHPDILDFISIKSVPNWVTEQIIQQLKWSKKFSEDDLEEIKKAIMENVQVRFANLSIKFSDEFFMALLEQEKYGTEAYVLYKKKEKGKIMDIYQQEKVHYSYGIPSKKIENYEFIGAFSTIDELNDYLGSTYHYKVEEADLLDPKKRDVYGDYVIEAENYGFDLAIRKAGDFLLYFGSEQTGSIKRLIKARKIWNAFLEGNYRAAEPGLIFWTRMKRYSPSDYVGRPILGTNPCSEVPLEDGGACNLGSINLSRFVANPFKEDAEIEWEKLREAVRGAVRFLDNVVEWNIYLHPLEKQKIASKETRRIGLGVMGIADMFFQLGLGYDSEAGLAVFEEVARFIANEAYKTSADLAMEKGPFPIYKFEEYCRNPFFLEALNPETQVEIQKKGLRNVALLSIAPTGTISNIAKSFELNDNNYFGISGGIEPLFALFYSRRSESFGNRVFKVFHSTVQAYLDSKGIGNLAQEAAGIEELKQFLPEYFFRTAHTLDPTMRVRIQGIAQKYVDHSISSTVNLAEDIEPEVISKIYIDAWKHGLKGITVYREGSRYPILSTDGPPSNFAKYKNKKFKIRSNGNEIVGKGSDVLVLPDGKLTTVYHLLVEKGIVK
ncbi:MAG: adenosylcobalamin-dependent ribonucleoside-diphosphate reductase [Candidatus Anstonellales archaeon]